jgi:hypothetical protein
VRVAAAEVKAVEEFEVKAVEDVKVGEEVKVVEEAKVVEEVKVVQVPAEVIAIADTPSLLLRTPRRASSIDPVRSRSWSNTRS